MGEGGSGFLGEKIGAAAVLLFIELGEKLQLAAKSRLKKLMVLLKSRLKKLRFLSKVA